MYKLEKPAQHIEKIEKIFENFEKNWEGILKK